jgi:hypothetical protein
MLAASLIHIILITLYNYNVYKKNSNDTDLSENLTNTFEPRHDKANIMGLRPTSAQSDQDQCCLLSVSLLVLGFVSEQHGS